MWQTLLEHCSEDRLNKYLDKVAEDQLAAEFLYVANQKVSESLYQLISVLEVSLRNRVHTKLHDKFGRTDWWTHSDLNIHAFQGSLDRVDRAKSKLFHRIDSITKKHQVKAGQIVAEVSFNFWTDLFSEGLQAVLWKDLMDCFPHLPQEARKRRKVAKPLDNLAKLRNRVMHHEPILFDETVLPSMHTKGTELVSWMSPEMVSWLAKRDRFPAVWREYQEPLAQMHVWLRARAELKQAREAGKAGKDLKPFYQAVEAAKNTFDELANQYLLNAKTAETAPQVSKQASVPV
ncbi:Abi family protein [Azohydromonas lata]|uniref:Abi family protein n=1 Tax=Azohydromonas lata TaxID=45677 RepID=UPI0012F4AB9E|nr:Abi family protein [Azohydromonas lata]